VVFSANLDMPARLTVRVAALTEDIGSVEYRIRYMGAKGRHLRGHESYRVAVAEIGTPGHS
jgi:hypothetical protein